MRVRHSYLAAQSTFAHPIVPAIILFLIVPSCSPSASENILVQKASISLSCSPDSVYREAFLHQGNGRQSEKPDRYVVAYLLPKKKFRLLEVFRLFQCGVVSVILQELDLS